MCKQRMRNAVRVLQIKNPRQILIKSVSLVDVTPLEDTLRLWFLMSVIDNSDVVDARTFEVGVILNVTAEISILTTVKTQIVVPTLILATKLMNIAVVTIPRVL
jgi:hypothetical protein